MAKALQDKGRPMILLMYNTISLKPEKSPHDNELLATN